MTRLTVDIYSAGCEFCSGVISMIKEVAGNSCDINVLDVNDEANGVRARSIGVQSLPAVAVGGKLLSCCSSDRITQDDLRSAGIGQLQEPR